MGIMLAANVSVHNYWQYLAILSESIAISIEQIQQQRLQ